MKKNLLILVVAATVLCGCKSLQHNVLVTTATVFGVSLAENPSTQLYEAKFGYARTEFAFVPGDTNCPGVVPDVIMELRLDSVFKGGLVYQRLAVGKNAVMQPGASLMFAKDSSGTLNSNAVTAISQKINAIDVAPH